MIEVVQDHYIYYPRTLRKRSFSDSTVDKISLLKTVYIPHEKTFKTVRKA